MMWLRPELRFTYNPMLAWRAALLWERSGFVGLPPAPEQIAEIDPAWLADIHTCVDFLEFERRIEQRPKGML
jgi:hypothetical protein